MLKFQILWYASRHKPPPASTNHVPKSWVCEPSAEGVEPNQLRPMWRLGCSGATATAQRPLMDGGKAEWVRPRTSGGAKTSITWRIFQSRIVNNSLVSWMDPKTWHNHCRHYSCRSLVAIFRSLHTKFFEQPMLEERRFESETDSVHDMHGFVWQACQKQKCCKIQDDMHIKGYKRRKITPGFSYNTWPDFFCRHRQGHAGRLSLLSAVVGWWCFRIFVVNLVDAPVSSSFLGLKMLKAHPRVQ